MTSPTAEPDDSRLVLIVDDFTDAREMYGEALVFAGFRIAEARHGAEAIEKALEIQPDLILMDLAMPGIDGWDATRVLKQHPRTKHIAIMALTSHALSGERDRAMRAGCDAFVAKPCLPKDLVAEIHRVLNAGSQQQPTS